MAENVKITYSVEVSHLPDAFEPDMDFLSESPKEAYEHFQKVSEKYKGHQIKITRKVTREASETISESQLEAISKISPS